MKFLFVLFCFFPSSSRGAHVGISIIASTSALASVTQVPVLPRPLRKLTRAVGGKGEEILVEMEVFSTDCFLLREIPLLTSYMEKLIQFTCIGG